MTVPAKAPTQGEIIEDLIIKGDLAKLTPEQRAFYYREVCRSLGLNELTKPFDYITLSGKLTLYANRSCADQLRKINGISLSIVSQKLTNDVLTVHVKARDRDGREDEDWGAVPFPDTLRGDARANQILKAVTKAKRRVTLSISGLGWIDETEIETIPEARAARLEAKADDEEEVVEDETSEPAADVDRGPPDFVLRRPAQRKEKPMDATQQAVIRCADPRFQAFLEETNSAFGLMTEGSRTDRAAELVRSICGVKSRKDITPGSEAANHWRDLESRFQAWMRI